VARPGLVWRETGANYWSGSSGSQPRGTVMQETSGLWVAYVRLEDPPGLSPITTVGPLRHGRRRAGRDRRGVGGEVDLGGRAATWDDRAQAEAVAAELNECDRRPEYRESGHDDWVVVEDQAADGIEAT
jgi:hypothetical protein